MNATALARPARFAPDPRRRAMLAKVHLAKKELGLTDDDYRAVLVDVAGVASAADCSDAELVAVIERFKQRGFQTQSVRPARAKVADHPTARKARALWISLYQLGAIENASEQALEAFARRQLGCERLQWANQQLGYRLIEALKAMAKRHGWSQDLAAMANLPSDSRVTVLRWRLADAILAKLRNTGLVPDDWCLDDAAFRLLGERREGVAAWTPLQLDTIIAGLEKKLRDPVRPTSVTELRG